MRGAAEPRSSWTGGLPAAERAASEKRCGIFLVRRRVERAKCVHAFATKVSDSEEETEENLTESEEERE